MKDYPDSRRAMDLIAEHRLRTLHSSSAWQFKQDALGAKSVSLGAKIESVLEVRSSQCVVICHFVALPFCIEKP